MYINKVKITIVTCVYNGESFIEKYAYRLNNIIDLIEQVIIIDDGSIDSSFTKIEECLLNNNKIEILQKENTGLAKSRNFSLKYIKNDYVIFLDIDDFIDREGLLSVHSILSNYSYDYIYGMVNYFSEENNLKLKCVSIIRNILTPNEEKIKKDIYYNNSLVTPGSCVFKMSIFDNLSFNDNLSIGEDWEFFTRVIPYKKGYYLKKKFINYFIYNGSMSSKLSNDKIKLNMLKERLVYNSGKGDDYKKYLDVNFYIFNVKKNIKSVTYFNIIKELMGYILTARDKRFFVFIQMIKLMVIKTF